MKTLKYEEVHLSGYETFQDVAVRLPDQLSQAAVKGWLDKGLEPGMAMTIDRLVERLRAKAA